MEENKELLNNTSEETVELQAEEGIAATVEENKTSKTSKPQKPKKLKNQAAFKRGGMALAITAVVVAALIILNVLVSALSKRVTLEFDMTPEKSNTISAENVDFIKAVEDEINVTVCATEDNYLSYISYYAQNYYQAEANTDYFEQTLKLIKKYEDYNKNINIQFIDTQSTEFTAFTSKYSTLNFIPGDILVSCERNGNERHKQISFADIYELTDQTGYASYGGSYTITGNNIESALTSAIAYVVSDETKRVALYTGHSAKNYSSMYIELLKDNNYEVDVLEDTVIKSISTDYDIAVLMAPSIDFMSEELDAISEFLNNDGKQGKGLMFFGDASNPALPNLSEFLVEWGIEINDGILFETDEKSRSASDPCTMYVYPSTNDLTSEMSACIVGYSIPMLAVSPADEAITATEYMLTAKSVVVAPVGVTADWSDYEESDKAQFAGVIQSVRIGSESDGTTANQSCVTAFASVEYIQSQWAEYTQLANKDITLACTNIAAGVTEESITFVSKTITNSSFASSVSAMGTKIIRLVFMILLPIVMVVAGIYIYIRRKNA